MKKIELAEIIENKNIAEGVYDMTLHIPHIAQHGKPNPNTGIWHCSPMHPGLVVPNPNTGIWHCSPMHPGQFLEIYLGKGEHLLPRPISICEVNRKNGTLRLVYQAVGKGTSYLQSLCAGQTLSVMGPVGNGFPIVDASDVVLVGGGIGVPPLLELAKAIKEKNPGANILAVLGFRDSQRIILQDDFQKLGVTVEIATDDGSRGFHGNTVAFLRQKNITADIFYACGPKIMLKFLAAYTAEKNMLCYVSMEERMACGLGACVGCVVKIKNGDDFAYKKVCADGPVFDAREVLWDAE